MPTSFVLRTLPSVTRDLRPLFQSAFIDGLIVAVLVLLVLGIGLHRLKSDYKVSDFDVFLTVGELYKAGRTKEAHDRATLQAAMQAHVAEQRRSPALSVADGTGASQKAERPHNVAWSYPPPFTALVALFTALPQHWSMPIFHLTTALAFLMALRRLAPSQTTFTGICVFPALLLNAIYGQNGALTGCLIGWSCVLLMRDRIGAGIPLGLMVIKPHLIAAVSLVPVFKRNVGVVGLALLTVVTACALSTWLLGPAIWPAFLDSTREIGGMLKNDQLPLQRMTSLYGTARLAGASVAGAMAIHFAGAALALVVMGYALVCRWSMRRLLATAVLASMLISPYLYDYDMPMLGVLVALLSPDLASTAGRASRMMVVALCWLIPAFSLVNSLPSIYESVVLGRTPDSTLGFWAYTTVAGLLTLGLLWLAVRVLTQAERAEHDSRHATTRPSA